MSMYPNTSQPPMAPPHHQGPPPHHQGPPPHHQQASIEMAPMQQNYQGPQPQQQPYPTGTPQGLNAFAQSLQANQRQAQGNDVYSKPAKGITAIQLRQSSWIKAGCAVSYTGSVKFQADSIITKGCSRFFQEQATGEGMNLMKASPNQDGSVVYVADEGKTMVNLTLNSGESVIVKGEDVVAFEESVQWGIERLKGGLRSAVRGGKYFIILTGPGNICIGCHGDPLVMPVSDNQPIRVDPDNAVLWTKETVPSTKHSVNTFQRWFGLYRSTGEEKQWQFSGNGFVVVQPVEEAGNRKRTKRFGIF